MEILDNLFYTQSHEWVKYLDDTTAKVGITDFAQDSLGDIVFVNLPQPGDTIEKGDRFADVESVKAVSDIYSPFTGEISAINENITDAPETLNVDPYSAWLIEVSGITDKKDLMDAKEYEEFCKKE